MRMITRFAGLLALLAFAATPALAAVPPSDTPKADLPAKAKAYGRHCQGQSKKRSDAAEGTRGTPFSQCVTAMAKLAKGTTDSPRAACKDLSKKHVEGEKGTPYSRCVVAGAKLRREQRAQGQC